MMTIPLTDVPVPQSLFANPDVTPAVLHTWIRLRALAGADGLIPACALKELAWRIGKSKSTLHTHLSLLRLLGGLDFTWPESGLWAVSFKPLAQASLAAEAGDQDGLAAAESIQPAAPSSEIRDADLANGASLSLTTINRTIKRGAGARAPVQLFESPPEVPDAHEPKSAQRNAFRPQEAAPKPPAPLPSDPAAVYRSVFGFNVRSNQRAILADQVTDLKAWQATLEHWLMHGWNPKNLTGMIDLYRRGGPEMCHFCQREQRSPAKAAPLNQTQQALKELYAYYQ